MKTQIEALQDNQVKLTVTVEAADVDARINKTYKDFAKKYRFPGFRPGKAPRPIIDNALGKQAVVATVTEELVNETYPLAVDQEELFVVGRPEFKDEDLIAEEGHDLVYDVVVTVSPEFELTSYEPVEIKLPAEEATQKEIDDQLEQLREYYYDFKDAAANTKVKDGSFLEMNVEAKDAEGNAIEALQAEGRVYEIGSGIFPAAFDAELMGLKKGQDKEFTVDMAAEPSMMGQGLGDKAGEVAFHVTVNVLKKKVLPEVDEKFATETLGFKSLEDLMDNVKTSITSQKKDMLPRLKETECLYALQERLDGEVPEDVCEQEERMLLQSFFQQLQQQGLSFDFYLQSQGLTADQFKEDIKKQARDVATQDAALDAWARHAGYEVTDEEVSEEFVKSGAADPAAMEAEWRENGQLHTLRRSIKRTRAVTEIMESAIVTEREEEEEEKPKAKKSSKKAKDAEKAEEPKAEEAAEEEKAE